MHSARKILSDSDRMMKVVLKRNNNNKIGKRNVIARHTMCVDKADPYFSFERQQMNVNFMEHIEVQYYFIGLVFRCRFIKAILIWFVRMKMNWKNWKCRKEFWIRESEQFDWVDFYSVFFHKHKSDWFVSYTSMIVCYLDVPLPFTFNSIYMRFRWPAAIHL